jgi:tetratricopeptide (TPR) repeat protein
LNIRILGESADIRGKAFEGLMFLVLEKLNYGNIKNRVHSIGMEFDLDAKHNDTGKPVLCECKAKEDQIGTTDLELFLAKLVHEDTDTSLTEGKFFSTSGFSGTAAKWHQTLLTVQKQRFKIYDSDGIIEILWQNGLILSDDKYDAIIRSHTKYQLGDRRIVYYDSQLYVVQTLRTGGAASHFMILTNEGELVNKQVEDAIVRLDFDLRSLSRIDAIQEKVILALLDSDSKTPSELASSLGENEKNVAIALDELSFMGLLTGHKENETKAFALNTSIETLTTLVNRFASTDKKYPLMSSKYLEKVLNDEYAKHVKDRFKLDLDSDLTKMLIMASRIFPSVLHYLLLGDNTPYLTSYQHLQQLQNTGGTRKRLTELSQSPFFHEIALRILTDMKGLDSNYLSDKKGIKGVHTKNIFKIASETNLIMSIYTEGTNFFVEAAGPIQAGSFLSATDISLYLRSGNIHYALELFNQAIEDYDIVIASAKDNPDLFKSAWHNKGTCYYAQEKCDDAVKCYLEALKVDANFIPSINNLIICYQELKDDANTKEFKERLAKIRSQK